MGKEQTPKKQGSLLASGDLANFEHDCVVSERRAAEILGYSKDTLRREFQAGRGPARVRLSARRIGYRLSVLYALLEARTEHNRALRNEQPFGAPGHRRPVAEKPRR